MDSSSVTSVFTNIHFDPNSLQSLLADISSTSAKKTFAPFSINALNIASPKPDAPPVTKATI